MSTETLRDLNSNVVAELRRRQTIEAAEKARAFRVGQKAKFFSDKRRRWVTIEIDRINTKSVSGAELDIGGNRTMTTWRVGPGLLQVAV